jgi:hypothetical protein
MNSCATKLEVFFVSKEDHGMELTTNQSSTILINKAQILNPSPALQVCQNYISINNFGYPIVHNSLNLFKTVVVLDNRKYYIEGSLIPTDDDGNSYGTITKFQEVILVEPSQVAVAASAHRPYQISTLVLVCFGHLDFLQDMENCDEVTNCFNDGYFRIGNFTTIFNRVSNQ